MTKFEEMDIDPRILRSLKEMGYEEAFPIQEKVQTPFMSGVDLIGQAKTGSGKTAAFGLPILHLVNPLQRELQALILAPTRELAVQITKEIERLARYTDIRTVTIYGGQSINLQIERLMKGPQIVVGTPGRVIDLLRRRVLNLSRVRYVILDEADRMLDMGFRDDIEYILESTPSRRQMSLFSATMPKEILELARKYMSNPQKILISADEPSVEELDQYYTVVDDGSKLNRLVELLKRERPVSAIIFCRTKIGAHRLARELEKRYFNVVPLHGDLSQYQRDSSMSAFRDGRVELLVATDVAARGIDVPGVQLVVNYDFPDDPLIYFHRVGRTARAGSSGRSVSILEPADFANFYRAQNLTKKLIKPLTPQDEQRALHPSHRRREQVLGGYRGRNQFPGSGYRHQQPWQPFRRK
jgi:ATP-dependent RNA helicase DeaD